MTHGPLAEFPRLRKARRVTGRHLALLDATEADAAFIHGLRTDPERSRYLSQVPPDVGAQVEWLRRYAADDSQAYFIITDAASGERLGTVRLYDALADSFSWGSWLLRAGLPARCAIESALIVYHYALQLGFRSSSFEVIQANASVWRFHENFGAERVGAERGHYQYWLSHEAIVASLRRYGRFLPGGITVEPLPGVSA